MSFGSSRPALLSGTMWSTSHLLHPGGFAWVRLNAETAFGSGLLLPCLSRGQRSHLVELRLLPRMLRCLPPEAEMGRVATESATATGYDSEWKTNEDGHRRRECQCCSERRGRHERLLEVKWSRGLGTEAGYDLYGEW